MDLNERINELLKQRNWTYYKLHKNSGIPRSTAEQLVKGLIKSTNHENLQKIASAFNITVSDLTGEETPEVINLENSYIEVAKVAQDKKINPEKLKALIELIAKDDVK